MLILYIGTLSESSTTYHRAQALKRLGHDLVCLEPKLELSSYLSNRIKQAFHYRTGYRFLQNNLTRWIQYNLEKLEIIPDVIWIDSGEYFGIKPLTILKEYCKNLVLYCVDDITGTRDGNRFRSARKALSMYSLCTTPRRYVTEEFHKLGVKNVHTFWRSYDEIVHKPFNSISEIEEIFYSDVVFVGTLIPGENRDEFILSLIEQGINISIWGSGWQKSPYWYKLKNHWKGKAVYGRDYTAAIQGAKICLGFLSKGNRDLHTRRSAEIPYSGGLFCAERTEEHNEMYIEGKEAVFWKDANECARKCKELLDNNKLRENIRENGMLKVRTLRCGNEKVVSDILDKLNNINLL